MPKALFLTPVSVTASLGLTGAGHYPSITGGGGDLNFLGPEHRVVAEQAETFF